MLVAVTDHAAERFRQRVRGTLDEKTEIASRVARAHAAGPRSSRGRAARSSSATSNAATSCTCAVPKGPSELVVITLWEEGEDAAVPKRFTNALRRDDHRVG